MKCKGNTRKDLAKSESPKTANSSVPDHGEDNDANGKHQEGKTGSRDASRDVQQNMPMFGNKFPPKLMCKGWSFDLEPSITSCNYESDAKDDKDCFSSSLLTSLPELKFMVSRECSVPILIGKWHCSYKCIKDRDGSGLSYNITVEKYWRRIFSQENDGGDGNNVVTVNASVEREVAYMNGKEAVKKNEIGDDGFVWFRPQKKEDWRVGLSSGIMESMRCDDDDEEMTVKVERMEEKRGRWRRFGCYVLVGSLVLRRRDGSLVLHCEFRHPRMITCKWE